MISGTITIADVDYKRCIQSFFPALLKKANRIENPGIAIRFLQKMGEDALPVMLNTMDYMTDNEKESLLLYIIAMFQEPICRTLNRFLSNQDLGDAIQISKIGAFKVYGTEGISLVMTDVQIDYDALLKTGLVSQNIDAYVDKFTKQIGLKGVSFFKGAAKIALKASVKAAPGEVEKKGVDLLNRSDIKEKMIPVIMEGLERGGLHLRVKDFSLIQDTIEIDVKTDVKLPEEVTESLLNAAAEYLKTAETK